MKQQHSSIGKSDTFSSNETARHSFQPILADSVEIMEYYYKGRIQELEKALTQLNILDNAREIAGLCKEIVRTKEVLQQILSKKEGGNFH